MTARRARLSLTVVVCSALLAACTGGGNGAPTTLATLPASTTAPVDDGILTVGAVLPTVGPAAELGVSMSAALAVAAEEINDAGGVNGRQVRLVLREEGDSP
ncbi:MAG TPA: ABC transporter substrate-binding protein, partial [Ilumatobacteraceae bacterium]|nr:ABC transporter substrate-binding protein [Ilumatobacteraceae bacterium]